MATDISRIYSTFSVATDRLFRQAMLRASRHRVLRVHHIVCATGDTDGNSNAQSSGGVTPELPETWIHLARDRVDEDPTGSLDTPMTNSPTIRRGLQLAWSRREGGEILPNHLVAVCLMCWRDEQPAGIVDRDEVRDFVSKMGTTHLPGFAPVMSTSPTINETTPIRIPSVEDLATLVGPAPTADDLIDLYLECEREADPVRKARLKLRLDYLTHRG